MMRELTQVETPIDRDSKYFYGINERLDVLIGQLEIVTRLLCEQYKVAAEVETVVEVMAPPATPKSKRKA